MEKGVLAIALGIFLTSFISAALFDGYGGFSIQSLFHDFVYSQDGIYFLFFLIIFTLCLMVLSKANLFRNFRGEPNVPAAAMVSFCISAIVIYYLYRSGFQGESLFSWLGFSGEALYTLIPIILSIAVILVVWRIGLKGLLTFGGLAVILTALFTTLIEDKTLAIIVGTIMTVLGLGLWKMFGKAASQTGTSMAARGRAIAAGYDWNKEKGQWRRGTLPIILGALITVLGVLLEWNWIVIVVGIVLVVIGILFKKF